MKAYYGSEKKKEEPPAKTKKKRRSKAYNTFSKDSLPLDRLDILKDRGFPAIQWAILAALLAVAVFQIYKTLKPKATPKSRTSVKRQKTGKKGKKSAPAMNRRINPPTFFSKKSKEAVTKNEATEEKLPFTRNLTKTKTKKLKPVKAKQAQEPALFREEPESLAVDNATIADASPMDALTSSTTVDDGDGWHTVGHGNSKLASQSDEREQGKSILEESKGSVVKSQPSESTEEGFTAVPQKSRKKQAKQKVATTQVPSTDGDAAFARELQKEEELAVKIPSTHGQLDSWAEVKTKKRRSKD
jgi:hypothetical protein